MNKEQIIAVILVGAGLIAGTFLIYQNQQSREENDINQAIGSIVVEKGGNLGDVKRTNLLVSTGDPETGASVPISSISIKLIIGEDERELEFLDSLQDSSEEVELDASVTENGDWLIPVNTIYQEDGNHVVELVLVNTSPTGFEAVNPFRLGSLYIRNRSVEYPDIEVSEEFTSLMSKRKPVTNILP